MQSVATHVACSSIVCVSVCVSVCQCVFVLSTRVSCAKTAEAIEILCGGQICKGPWNLVLDGGPQEGALWRGTCRSSIVHCLPATTGEYEYPAHVVDKYDAAFCQITFGH